MPSISRTDLRTPAAQITDSLRADITSGRLGIGAVLPSERELASAWGVSTTTIARAIAQLRHEGFIESRPGAPRRVQSHPPRRQLHRTGSGTGTGDQLQFRTEKADVGTAQALAIEQGSEVLTHETAIGHEQMTSTRLPRDLVRGTRLEQSGTGSIREALAERGHPVARVIDAIHARTPTPGERDALELHPGASVLTVTRISYDPSGRPLVFETATLVGLRVELLYEVPVE